jgi:hypothetical protein
MLGTITAFLLGVFLAPVVRPLFRPLMVELVRAGLAISDEAKRLSAELQEGVEDAKAEADATRSARPASRPASARPAAAPEPASPAAKAAPEEPIV